MRRRRSNADKPWTARDDAPPFQQELRDRLTKLEAILADLQHSIDAQTTRCTAIQAQLDHVLARGSR